MLSETPEGSWGFRHLVDVELLIHRHIAQNARQRVLSQIACFRKL